MADKQHKHFPPLLAIRTLVKYVEGITVLSSILDLESGIRRLTKTKGR